jgi:CheY-like chemotaxis protein
LPRTTALPAARRSEEVLSAPLLKHEATILVVDDDGDVRQLAVSCLESLGYRTIAANSGQAAIEIVASGSRLDMVLIDIAMPETTGIEAMHAILSKQPNLPFLYMTGYVGPTKLDPSEQRVLKKPFTIAELAAKIEEVLFPNEATGGRPTNIVPLKAGRPA